MTLEPKHVAKTLCFQPLSSHLDKNKSFFSRNSKSPSTPQISFSVTTKPINGHFSTCVASIPSISGHSSTSVSSSSSPFEKEIIALLLSWCRLRLSVCLVSVTLWVTTVDTLHQEVLFGHFLKNISHKISKLRYIYILSLFSEKLSFFLLK